MITIYRFKEFNFQKFLEFDRELVDVHHLGEVKFYPKQGRNLFSKVQLEHTAPGWDINHSGGFLFIWKNNKDAVSVVTFEQFNKNGISRIEMTIDLNKKIISLDEVQGINLEKIEESLNKFFEISRINYDVSKWWKYTHPVWWIWLAIVLIFKDGMGNLLKLAWEHKLISGLILLFLVPLIVQLVAAYLSYKFGWNK